MAICNRWIGLLSGVLGLCAGSEAAAQTAAPPQTAPAAAPAPAPAPAAAPAPATAPAAAPVQAPPAAPAGVPPGYMLVPIPDQSPKTQYDVLYPQGRGALPPGMELPYDEGQPVPPGYRVVEQRRRGLIIAGSLLTGIPWAFSVTGAVAADFDNESGFLLVPGIGPWLMLAAGGAKDRDCSPTDPTFDAVCNSDKAGVRAVLVLDGLVQTAGAVMFVIGMTNTRKRLVRNDVFVSISPVRVGTEGYGFGVRGAF